MPKKGHYATLTFFVGGGGAKRPALPKTCHTSYNDETWHSYSLRKGYHLIFIKLLIIVQQKVWYLWL